VRTCGWQEKRGDCFAVFWGESSLLVAYAPCLNLVAVLIILSPNFEVKRFGFQSVRSNISHPIS